MTIDEGSGEREFTSTVSNYHHISHSSSIFDVHFPNSIPRIPTRFEFHICHHQATNMNNVTLTGHRGYSLNSRSEQYSMFTRNHRSCYRHLVFPLLTTSRRSRGGSVVNRVKGQTVSGRSRHSTQHIQLSSSVVRSKADAMGRSLHVWVLRKILHSAAGEWIIHETLSCIFSNTGGQSFSLQPAWDQ